MAAVGSYSVTLSGCCGSHEGFERESPLYCRSLSSIHILYNQALVGGLSTSLDPGTRIVNLPLNGGRASTFYGITYIVKYYMVHCLLLTQVLEAWRGTRRSRTVWSAETRPSRPHSARRRACGQRGRAAGHSSRARRRVPWREQTFAEQTAQPRRGSRNMGPKSVARLLMCRTIYFQQ